MVWIRDNAGDMYEAAGEGWREVLENRIGGEEDREAGGLALVLRDLPRGRSSCNRQETNENP